ncbi:hypothetical protein [Candidatus Thiosymbion oneisti]|uniref:hypothetical protein n=1 Tax=Candidatus Thiosymbion oneisti TaxID=589554 RepID=UPI00105C7B1F|nr:hypothetical protein [Candidatus Thiosymbion oneisti]
MSRTPISNSATGNAHDAFTESPKSAAASSNGLGENPRGSSAISSVLLDNVANTDQALGDWQQVCNAYRVLGNCRCILQRLRGTP